MSRLSAAPAWAKTGVLIVIVATSYVATARLGLTLAMPPGYKATAVWPPSGIALASLLLAGRRAWAGIWLGSFLANLWDVLNPATPFSLGTHLAVSFGIATGSTLQALLGAMLIRVLIDGDNFLERTRSVFQFVVIALVMCLVASNIGVLSLVLGGVMKWEQYGIVWSTWWLGDSVGVLLITPWVACWKRAGWPTFAGLTRLAEAIFLTCLLVAVGVVALAGRNSWTPAYLAVPLIVWAAFRFGPRGATTALILLSACAIWGTVRGLGPFVEGTLYESLLAVQAFVGVLAITALTLIGVLEERRRGEEAKVVLIERLERALGEIKTLRGLIPICAWCKRIRNDRGAWEQLESYLHDHTEATFSHGICPECLERH